MAREPSPRGLRPPSQAGILRLGLAHSRTKGVSMFRTSRTAMRGRAALTWMGDWRLPGPERRAARSERAAEQRMRRERDGARYSETARRAAIEAERQRVGGAGGPLHGP